MLGAISLSNSSHSPISVKSMMNVKPGDVPTRPLQAGIRPIL
jgi:hypothetical protein